ncbi:unnamed protein product, partial [Brenthis ino]
MFLIYFMLFIAVNVTSCVHIPDEIYPKGTSAKSFSRKSLNGNLGDSGPLLKLSPTDTSSDQSKVIKENYFPDVIYPTNILDVAQPFFFRVNAYDEVLGPFSEDVKSSYKSISSNTKKTTSKNRTPNYDDEIQKNVSQSQINYNMDKVVNFEEDIIEISKCNESHEKNVSEVSNEDNYYDMSFIEQEQQMNESVANSNLSFSPSWCTNETVLEVVEEVIENVYNKTTLIDKQECDFISIVDSKECENGMAYLNVDDEDSLKEKNKLKSENSEAKVPIEVKISIEVFRNNPGKQINPIQDIDFVLGPGIIVDDSMNEEKNETLIEKGTILRNIDLIERELKLFENELATINETSFENFNGPPSYSSIESFERENITDDTLFLPIEKLSWTVNDSLIDLLINLPSNISKYNASNYSAPLSEDDSENNATNVYTVPLVIYLKSNTSIDDSNNDTYITNINNSGVQDEDFFLDLIISLDTLCETNTTELQHVKNFTDLYVIDNLRELLSEDNIRNITLYSVNANKDDDY